MRYPKRFVAVAPTASASVDASHIDLLSGPSIWFFQSESYSLMPFHKMRTFGSPARNRVCIIKLTETLGGIHDCWTAALQEHTLLEWLLKKRHSSRDTGIKKAKFPPN